MADSNAYLETTEDAAGWFLLNPDTYPRPVICDKIRKLMERFNATYVLDPETSMAFVKSTGKPYFESER